MAIVACIAISATSLSSNATIRTFTHETSLRNVLVWTVILKHLHFAALKKTQ